MSPYTKFTGKQISVPHATDPLRRRSNLPGSFVFCLLFATTDEKSGVEIARCLRLA